MKHAPFQHEHPSRAIALRTRTKIFGTLNLAVALGGRSCGWGSCDRPRRTFVGRFARSKPDTGRHFVELVTYGPGLSDQRTMFRVGDPEPHDFRGENPDTPEGA